MSDHANFDEAASRRNFKAPYSSRHPVPNVQGYEETLQTREKDTTYDRRHENVSVHATSVSSVIDAAKNHLLHRHCEAHKQSGQQQPYQSQNRNCEATYLDKSGRDSTLSARTDEDTSQPADRHVCTDGTVHDPEYAGNTKDQISGAENTTPMRREHQGREVTDPVTHLPIVIHDATSPELHSVPENKVHASSASHSEKEDHSTQESPEQQVVHYGMKALFPPPNFEATGQQLASIVKAALTAGLGFLLGTSLLLLIWSHLYHARWHSEQDAGHTRGWSISFLFSIAFLLSHAALGTLMIFGTRTWVEMKTRAMWEDETWNSARTHDDEDSANPVPESVQWLNSLLISVWPLVNPDLFTTLADTLEDVMQASLPKFVRMISVDDLGQGNEAIRILGIKWLPPGNARKDVSTSGKTRERDQGQGDDTDAPEDGERVKGDNNPDPRGGIALPEGMEAEEGDFVNVEVGFAYRASSTGKTMRVKAKNAHLYLIFYLPGGIQLRKFTALDRSPTYRLFVLQLSGSSSEEWLDR